MPLSGITLPSPPAHSVHSAYTLRALAVRTATVKMANDRKTDGLHAMHLQLHNMLFLNKTLTPASSAARSQLHL